MNSLEEYFSAIEAREKAATKGRWRMVLPHEGGPVIFGVTDAPIEDGDDVHTLADCFQFTDEQDRANAEFIADSKQSMPVLMALVRKYREALDVACVASCSCMTKSGDYELHAETCRYKQLRTALAYDPREEGKK